MKKHYDHCPIAADENGSLGGSRLGRWKVLGKRGSSIDHHCNAGVRMKVQVRRVKVSRRD